MSLDHISGSMVLDVAAMLQSEMPTSEERSITGAVKTAAKDLATARTTRTLLMSTAQDDVLLTRGDASHPRAIRYRSIASIRHLTESPRLDYLCAHTTSVSILMERSAGGGVGLMVSNLMGARIPLQLWYNALPLLRPFGDYATHNVRATSPGIHLECCS